MTKITKNHYIELIIRTILFLTAIFTNTSFITNNNNTKQDIISSAIWIFFIGSMILRLIPNKKYSAGNQKIFKSNFIQAKETKIKRDYKSAIGTLIVWMLLNGIIGFLYFKGIITPKILFYISLAYSVCDIICILWFCPFQKWIMKNRCCNTCRIYNWDFAMMFTPLIFVPNLYNYTLVGLSLIIVLIWEITYYKHPERFHSETNNFINCKNCKERMCKNKLRFVKGKDDK